MGADAFYVYFGVRYTIGSEEELEGLELGKDSRLTAARKQHLSTCFDRPTDGDEYFLLIGSRVGAFGVENAVSAELTDRQMQRLAEETKPKLIEAGFLGEPKFYFQLVAQY